MKEKKCSRQETEEEKKGNEGNKVIDGNHRKLIFFSINF